MACAMFALCNINLSAFPGSFDESRVVEVSILANPSPYGEAGYMVVTNGQHPTYWEVVSPVQGSSGFMTIPKEWTLSPKYWERGWKIKMMFKGGNVNFPESYAVNQNKLERCTHVFEFGGYKLLARHIADLGDFLNQVYNFGYDRGCKSKN